MSEENKTPEPKPAWQASFDARDWAKEFMRSCKQSPIVGAVAPDEETMVGWFANALMRGYDEHRWKIYPELKRLAEWAHANLYGGEPRGWRALPEVAGVLSQLDNMLAGMARKRPAAEPDRAPEGRRVSKSRSDLESRVQITWERIPGQSACGTEKCVASLALRREAVLDRLVERMFPCGPVSVRREIGERLKRDLVSSVLGGLESENARLRAAVEKWGRRARVASFPPNWYKEMEEDLK